MFAGTWVLFRFDRSFWTSFGVVLLEPAGWFTFWEGLDLLVMRGRNADPELDFYRKMSGARISFSSRS
jgi:hypothetical protein